MSVCMCVCVCGVCVGPAGTPPFRPTAPTIASNCSVMHCNDIFMLYLPLRLPRTSRPPTWLSRKAILPPPPGHSPTPPAFHAAPMSLFDIKMQSILLTNFAFITRFVYVNLCTWHLHIIDVALRHSGTPALWQLWWQHSEFGIKVKHECCRMCVGAGCVCVLPSQLCT